VHSLNIIYTCFQLEKRKWPVFMENIGKLQKDV